MAHSGYIVALKALAIAHKHSQSERKAIASLFPIPRDRRELPFHLMPRQVFSIAYRFVESSPLATGRKA
ncbi:hypothetical protein [Altericista sp. CCNU0014]|uniref:hypothetical protein n=1 Tax=Altericista sp. CCNU0014 TaxID=3082949 RepID=UPI00384D3985